MLAKLGSKLDSENSIDRILDRPPESSNVSLYWKDKIVEIPTRKFLKEILDIKTGAEWRFTSPIQKIEPEPEKTAHE